MLHSNGNEIKAGVSLFSGGGFGDMGFAKSGIEHLILAEKDPERAAFAASQFPHACVLSLDLANEANSVISQTRSLLKAKKISKLHLLYATPPCQGMSKNGLGTILRAMSEGKREAVDKRNRLYQPFLDVVSELKPTWVFFENVCRLFNFKDVDENGAIRTIPEIIERHLSSLGYAGCIEQVQMADYGLPQTRLRSVGIFRLREKFPFPKQSSFIPSKLFHKPSERRTLRDVIFDTEPLDAIDSIKRKSMLEPLHSVPKWRSELYNWMKHTPEGKSAFTNNECLDCNHFNEDLDIECVNCGALLPKPTVFKNGERRRTKGFVSAYKRMYWDKPGSTVTTRSAYCCSDHKGHPDQNRVLSIYEVAILQGIDVNAVNWQKDDGTYVRDTLLRDLIGECVPPMFTELVGKHLCSVDAALLLKSENIFFDSFAKDKQMSIF